jgi:hypothetical protein
MPNDKLDLRSDPTVFSSWGSPAGEGHDAVPEGPGLWLTGGAALLAWTALALLLTA